MSHKIGYTTGYVRVKPPVLKRVADHLQAIVYDIRQSPRSYHKQYTKAGFEELLGDNYVHLGEFGNVNFKGGECKIRDFDAGYKRIHLGDRPAIFMCGCIEFEECHRRFISAMLAAKGWQMSELDDIVRELESTSAPVLF